MESSTNINHRKYRSRKINCTAWKRCCSDGWWGRRHECWCPGPGTPRRSTVVSTPAHSSSIKGKRARYLLNGVNNKIYLVRSKDSFALILGDNFHGYKINVVDAAVFARKATLNTTVQVAHAASLETKMVKLQLRRVVCKVYSISQAVVSCLIRTTTCISAPCRNELCCVALTTTLTTAPTITTRYHTLSFEIGECGSLLYVGKQSRTHHPENAVRPMAALSVGQYGEERQLVDLVVMLAKPFRAVLYGGQNSRTSTFGHLRD